jgi:hypothetical protein
MDHLDNISLCLHVHAQVLYLTSMCIFLLPHKVPSQQHKRILYKLQIGQLISRLVLAPAPPPGPPPAQMMSANRFLEQSGTSGTTLYASDQDQHRAA